MRSHLTTCPTDFPRSPSSFLHSLSAAHASLVGQPDTGVSWSGEDEPPGAHNLLWQRCCRRASAIQVVLRAGGDVSLCILCLPFLGHVEALNWGVHARTRPCNCSCARNGPRQRLIGISLKRSQIASVAHQVGLYNAYCWSQKFFSNTW